ncbi:3'-5' exonuclease [Vibrio astriarenae]
MKHVMIDIETMGSNHNAPVLQIGARAFDLDGSLGAKLNVHVSMEDQVDNYGRKPDASTVLWWMQQSDAARSALVEGQESLEVLTLPLALAQLSEFISQVDGAVVWGNGASFDITILEAAYEAIGKVEPWKFWNVRDVRTIMMFDHEGVKKSTPFDGVAHEAVADCDHQIKYMTQVMKNRGLVGA